MTVVFQFAAYKDVGYKIGDKTCHRDFYFAYIKVKTCLNKSQFILTLENLKPEKEADESGLIYGKFKGTMSP